MFYQSSNSIIKGKTIAQAIRVTVKTDEINFQRGKGAHGTALDEYETYFEEIREELEESVKSEYTKKYYDYISIKFSTLDWIMEKLLNSAGFTISHSSLDNKFMATYVCTK